MAVTETTRESAEKWVGRWSMILGWSRRGHGQAEVGWWLAMLAQVAVALCCQCISHRKLGASLTDLENELDMSEGPLRVVF